MGKSLGNSLLGAYNHVPSLEERLGGIMLNEFFLPIQPWTLSSPILAAILKAWASFRSSLHRVPPSSREEIEQQPIMWNDSILDEFGRPLLYAVVGVGKMPGFHNGLLDDLCATSKRAKMSSCRSP